MNTSKFITETQFYESLDEINGMMDLLRRRVSVFTESFITQLQETRALREEQERLRNRLDNLERPEQLAPTDGDKGKRFYLPRAPR